MHLIRTKEDKEFADLKDGRPSVPVKDMTNEELEQEIEHPKYTFLFACIGELNKRLGKES